MNAKRWLQRPKKGYNNDKRVATMTEGRLHLSQKKKKDDYISGLRNIGKRPCQVIAVLVWSNQVPKETS